MCERRGQREEGWGGGGLEGQRFKVQRGVKETEVSGNKGARDPGVKPPGVRSHRAGAAAGPMAPLV